MLVVGEGSVWWSFEPSLGLPTGLQDSRGSEMCLRTALRGWLLFDELAI